MCEQLYLMSFWICQLHGRRQRNIRCQHPLLISWIIIHISRNIHIYFLIFHLNIYSSLPHHPLKTFPPPLPLQRCTWRSPLLNQRRQGWAFSVMQRNIPLLNVCQLLQRIPGLSNAVQGGSSEIRLFNGNPPLKQPVIGFGWNTACKLKIEND